MAEKQAGRTMEIIESGVRESIPTNVNSDIIIAYEPRWAIGAGLTPTDEEIAEQTADSDASKAEGAEENKNDE